MLCFLAEQNIDGLDIVKCLSEEEVGFLANNILGDKIKLSKAIQSLKVCHDAFNQLNENDVYDDVCINLYTFIFILLHT